MTEQKLQTGARMLPTQPSFCDQKLPGNLGHAVLKAGGGAERLSKNQANTFKPSPQELLPRSTNQRESRSPAQSQWGRKVSTTWRQSRASQPRGLRAIPGSVYHTCPAAESPNRHHREATGQRGLSLASGVATVEMEFLY